jgi:hypothetical protein
MSELERSHHPSPEFVAALEREVLGNWHAATGRAVPATRTRWRERFRMAAVLAIGLIGGFGAQLASAQVQSAKVRDEMERSITIEALALEHRLARARAELERVQAASAAGAATDREVRRAALEAAAMELQLARLKLNHEEVLHSRVPPRDELWAPMVGNRDYVKERLNLMADLVRQGVAAAEADERRADHAVRIGVEGVWVLHAAQLKLVEEQARLQQLLAAMQLREEVLKHKLSAEEVARRQQLLNLELGLTGAEQRLKIARERLSRMQAMVSSGLTTQIEVKRAELDLLEQELGLERLSAEAARLRRELGNRQINFQFGKSGG